MVAQLRKKPLIFILNTSIELIEALETAFQMEGYDTVQEVVTHIKRNKKPLRNVLQGKQPDVMVYDVGLPYKENWEFLHKLRTAPEIVGTSVIITTTNKAALERLIEEDSHAFEITGVIGKPFDLDILLKAVAEAVKEVQYQRVLENEQNMHKSSSQ